MPSGAPAGLGEQNSRFATLSQSLAAAGVFVLEFPEEFAAFTWQVTGGTPNARDVLLGLGKQDASSKVNAAGVQDAVDVTVLSGVKQLEVRTRWVFIYVAVAVAGATIRVTGVDGEPEPLAPSAPTAAAIAAALAGQDVDATIVAPLGTGTPATSVRTTLEGIGGSEDVTGTIAAIPPIVVSPVGRRGATGVNNTSQVTVAAGANTALAAAQATWNGIYVRVVTAGGVVYLKGNDTSADAEGVLIRDTDPPFYYPMAGVALRAYNPGGAGVDISLLGIVAYA